MCILNYRLSVFAVLLIILQSCCYPPEKEAVVIAISKESPNYTGWLSRFEENVEYKNLYPLGVDSAIKVLQNCNGLLLTGGEDVFPAYYGQIGDTVSCGTIDYYRDSLEFALISYAIKNKMPIIGVCRGEQILNVALGGSLYVDIPGEFDSYVIHRQDDWRNCYHDVFLVDSTLLEAISSVEFGKVTSNHHQGIKKLGNGLRVSAYSADSLPEAVEWENRGDKSFLMAVQWHPERMDTLHLLSAPMAREFLDEARLFQESKEK
ncbi:MAG: gamma-glutamyl-gamma-aminobutyrate hydrolase family protein [Chlorobi bacterium]|nr:gamma-glutamyl-gamma-aminobutyrate hydrolase family protein [Chlorobiota bacterium]